MTKRWVNQESLQELDCKLRWLNVPKDRIPQVMTDITHLTELALPLKDISFQNWVLYLSDDTQAVSLTTKSWIWKILTRNVLLKVVKKQVA